MTTLCVVQARLGSSRLPGKCLLALAGRPMIAHVLERARAIPGVDGVVLATSLADRDSALETLAQRLQYPVYRGDEHDVLHRFAVLADVMQADTIVRVTGDCPFLAPDVAGEVLTAYRETNPLGAEYFSNDTTCSGYPDGTDVEVFSRALLIAADRAARSREDREHVTPWMRRTATTGMIKSDTDWSSLKLSVDTQDDYARAVLVARALAAVTVQPYALSTTMQVVMNLLTYGDPT